MKIPRADIVCLLKTTNERELNALFTDARKIRARYFGSEVHVRGLLNFSNHCARDCRYCGFRRSNANIERFRMGPDEIVEAASEAARRVRST